MKFDVIKKWEDKKSENIVLFVPSGSFPKDFTTIDKTFTKKIQEVVLENDERTNAGNIFICPKSYLGEKRLIIVGLGNLKKLGVRQLKEILSSTAKHLQSQKISDYIFYFSKSIVKYHQFPELIKSSVVSVKRATYHFDGYKTDEKTKKVQPQNISIVSLTNIDNKKILKIISEGESIGNAINFTRELGNLPPIDMTPSYLAKEAIQLGTKHKKLKVKVLGRSEIQKEKMGGLLGVSLGSDQEPKFIILEWRNAKKSAGNYVFVGKAITFDSGGISIKPSQKMDEMKFDMLGGGSVLGAMKAVVEMNLKINLTVLIPSSENLLGARAYRPGDILKARNGKTIEVQNTDAEGRIILADALSYAKEYDPKFVFDLATLTGSCMVALGGGHEAYAGLFTRNEKFANLIKTVAQKTGEKIWQLPLDDDFSNMVKSTVADVSNVGSSRYAGASTAAAFLENFTDYPWAHLDIAGVAWAEEKPYIHAGANGFGVQTLIELAKHFSKK